MAAGGEWSALICEAIRRRRLLELTYRGSRRLIEPYSHGASHEGRGMLMAFQRAGGSASGHAEGWKAFHVDEIDKLDILDVTFVVNQPGYRDGGLSKNLSDVHCCV